MSTPCDQRWVAQGKIQRFLTRVRRSLRVPRHALEKMLRGEDA